MTSMVPFQHQCEDPGLVRRYCNLKSSNHSYPIFCMSITTSSSAVDVNLTPDKSQVLLHDKESVYLLIEDILMSLYGPRTRAAGGETDVTDAASVDIFPNETGQTDVPVNEIESCGNPALPARTSLFSFNNDVRNGETGKNTEVCLKNQTSYNDSPPNLLTEKELPGSETVGFDRVQEHSLNNLPDEGQRSRYQAVNTNGAILKDALSENGIGDDLRSDKIQEAEKMETPKIPEDSSEISADKWSTGHAFTNSRGENLEPVRLLIPETEEAGMRKENNGRSLPNFQAEKNDPSSKKTNVVNEKAGQITAYDLIKSQIVRKPVTAFGLFTQDSRSKLSTDKLKASAEELRLEMEEMWEALNEKEKKK
uniref:Uncharacterized protein n=1 Tax=Sphaerodactylus townsendi TaxID=933632 RepID=A0ACB8FZK2_9SAUR